MQRDFNVPATNWAMVGRWVGHMPRGHFMHENIGRAAPVSGEHAIGWIVHYIIGMAATADAPSPNDPGAWSSRRSVLHHNARHGRGDCGGQDTAAERDSSEKHRWALRLWPRHVCDCADDRGRRWPYTRSTRRMVKLK